MHRWGKINMKLKTCLSILVSRLYYIALSLTLQYIHAEDTSYHSAAEFLILIGCKLLEVISGTILFHACSITWNIQSVIHMYIKLVIIIMYN